MRYTRVFIGGVDYKFTNYNFRKPLNFQKKRLNVTRLARVFLTSQGFFSEIIVGKFIVGKIHIKSIVVFRVCRLPSLVLLCVYAYIYIYIHTYTHTHIHTHIHIHMHIHVYIYIYIYTHIYTYMCSTAQMRAACTSARNDAANLCTKILEFRGFGSSRIVSLNPYHSKGDP